MQRSISSEISVVLDILLLESLTYIKKANLVLLRKILVSGQYWLAELLEENRLRIR
ncbi:hypothetical protein TIIST44_08160 [Cutibacterium acnes subsp. defendens ATCC 11828]|nr:hypothetical protein TIIST44_08160 [Cutibacterium acnes subsp. defendens ATCC 11828]